MSERERQLARVVELSMILDAKRQGATAKELAKTLGVNVRTVYRDLDALEKAGLALTKSKTADGTRHYVMEGARQKVKLSFTPTELIALRLATMTSFVLEGTIFHDSLVSARKKVEATLSDQHRDFASAFQSMFQTTFRPVRNYAKFRDVIEAITNALLKKRRLEITYWTPSSGKISDREIEPYRLWFVNNALYVIAYCRLRKGVKTFLVDRIRKWGLTDKNYEIPKGFSFEEYASSGFKVLGGVEDQEVVVRVHPILKPQITEQTWHPSQQVEELENGWLRVRFRLGALDEIKTWIQGYAPYIIVEKPKELIKDIAIAFKETLQLLSNGSNTNG